MINLGNHLKTTAHPMHRDKIRSFYKDILRCEMISAPYPDFDLFQFENNVIFGVFYSTDCLSDKDLLKGTWLEIKTNEAQKLKEAMLKAGVTEVDYTDKTHFYFQAPGGQVFRIVSDAE